MYSVFDSQFRSSSIQSPNDLYVFTLDIGCCPMQTGMAREWCHNSFSHSAKQIRRILSFGETNSANSLIRRILSFGELSHSANSLIRRVFSFGETNSANYLIRRIISFGELSHSANISFGELSHSANYLIRRIISFGELSHSANYLIRRIISFDEFSHSMKFEIITGQKYTDQCSEKFGSVRLHSLLHRPGC